MWVCGQVEHLLKSPGSTLVRSCESQGGNTAQRVHLEEFDPPESQGLRQNLETRPSGSGRRMLLPSQTMSHALQTCKVRHSVSRGHLPQALIIEPQQSCGDHFYFVAVSTVCRQATTLWLALIHLLPTPSGPQSKLFHHAATIPRNGGIPGRYARG